MTHAVRKIIYATFAATILATSIQPAQAGHRHHHHHRHFDGYSAAAGLVGGMIIGSAIANAQQRPVYVNHRDAHVAWCLDRYRSYNISTDTFMSHSGYRKYCNSPYN